MDSIVSQYTKPSFEAPILEANAEDNNLVYDAIIQPLNLSLPPISMVSLLLFDKSVLTGAALKLASRHDR
jgi:hypothetical protein